jgi:AbrB family looped-hinge helix DNA binding protein
MEVGVAEAARESDQTVTISPKYHVVIPRQIRKQLQLRPGQKLAAILYDGRIQLVPVMPPEEARGFLKGMDTDVCREEDPEC